MSEGQKNKGGRPKGIRYPDRLMVYTTERQTDLLRRIAERREVGLAEAIRQLIREEARRQGWINGEDAE